MDIKAMFKSLEELKKNNWLLKEKDSEPPAPKKGRPKRRCVKYSFIYPFKNTH